MSDSYLLIRVHVDIVHVIGVHLLLLLGLFHFLLGGGVLQVLGAGHLVQLDLVHVKTMLGNREGCGRRVLIGFRVWITDSLHLRRILVIIIY